MISPEFCLPFAGIDFCVPLLTQILTYTWNLLDSAGEEAADGVHIPDREPRLHGVLAPPCRKGAPLFHEQF